MLRNRDIDEDNEKNEISASSDALPTRWHPDAETIAAIQENVAYQAAEDTLSESALTRDYVDGRRYTSEAAACVTVGNEAIDLDKFTEEKELGLKGNNYPIYDISSTSEVASVKTHWNSDGQLDANALSAYKRDFAKQHGWNRSPTALQDDGKNIIAARDAGAAVPQELENATVEEASTYLRDNSCLRIPDDHVDAVRAELEDDVRKFPSNYYLPENPSEQKIKHILERVQGIGLTSSELQAIIKHRLEQ